MEQWITADEVLAARRRFIDAIPGFVQPVAYGVARVDSEQLAFGHLNEVGGTHLLPAAVLATVCGHVAGNATYELDVAAFDRAIELLEPAEACTDFDHPNLWSWRELRRDAAGDSRFAVVFIDDVSKPPTDEVDSALRARLGL